MYGKDQMIGGFAQGEAAGVSGPRVEQLLGDLQDSLISIRGNATEMRGRIKGFQPETPGNAPATAPSVSFVQRLLELRNIAHETMAIQQDTLSSL